MKGRLLFFIGLFSTFSLFLTPLASAQVSVPSFPDCGATTGTPIASYSNGTHGIAGDSGSYTGSDNVYQINDNQVLQCYCNGSTGIQTNWLKISDLTQAEIDQYQKLGWTYIPTGAAWGLQDVPYLAFNVSGTCTLNGGFTPTVLGASTVTDGLTNSICARCFWWPILLGEIVVLILALYGLRKKKVSLLARFFGVVVVAAGAYIIFVFLNAGKCPFGVMDFKLFTLPCKLFWAVDGIVALALFWLFKLKFLKKSSTQK